MKPFLYHVAKDLIGRFGNNLSGVTIVFPGKRAELYMNSFLSHIAQGPVWAPRFRTIDELFQQFSELVPSDNIVNVCRLYRIYAELVPDPESPDDFYGWGEVLMNDFNDIDKHMVDAERLFANAADLSKLDSVDYLSKEQVEALRQFFDNFSLERQTELKRRFMRMWQAMPEMYRRLKEELRKEGEMYKGALYREVAERLLAARKTGSPLSKSSPLAETDGTIYAFIGFNVLDEVEETLFTALRDANRAIFYWDYDVSYTAKGSDHEAGLFMRRNLEKFPQALDSTLFDNLLTNGKKIRFLAATTDNAQVRYLPQWLEERKEDKEKTKAIVLCDEALMRATIHAIPQGTNANITMGYPLTDTAIQGYFSALIDLQVDGYNADMKRFLPTALERVEKNPFFSSFPKKLQPIRHQGTARELLEWLTVAAEALGKSLTEMSSPSPYDQLYAEATFQLYKILNKFRKLTDDGILDVHTNTLRRLIRQALASTDIPFHGDMDKEIQIMGLLEARNLDFSHLVMLSVGEGILPRKACETSLIPYILRNHFGLDTTQRQDAVYAYSFYRLLQRAEDITLVYNENSSGASQREQSRFLRQLATETELPIRQMKIDAPFSFTPTRPVTVEKDEHVMKILLKKKMLSPTAINQYIECPMRFYYQQVAHLRMPDRPQDGIDNARFGTLFHDTCELFYTHLARITGRRQVLRSDLEPLFSRNRSNEVIPAYTDLVFWMDFFHGLEYDSRTHASEREAFLQPYLAAPDYHTLNKMVNQLYEGEKTRYFTGVNMIIREVILRLVGKLLRWDMEHTPFTMIGMEIDRFMDFNIPTTTGDITLSIGGRIDRMDIMQMDGHPTLRIVDYKTGKSKNGPSSIEGIFDASGLNAHGYYLQTFLYALIMSKNTGETQPLPNIPVCPCLFYILSANDAQQYDPTLKLGREIIRDIREVADEYTEGLRRVITEIYDSTRPFTQTEQKKIHCEHCDFQRLCGLPCT